MSTLRTNRIELGDGSAGVGTEYVVGGGSKAWAYLDGQAPSVRNSLNVSSVTDLAVGQLQVNLSNIMLSAEYVVHVTSTNGVSIGFAGQLSAPRTASQYPAWCKDNNGNWGDTIYLGTSVLGDLA